MRPVRGIAGLVIFLGLITWAVEACALRVDGNACPPPARPISQVAGAENSAGVQNLADRGSTALCRHDACPSSEAMRPDQTAPLGLKWQHASLIVPVREAGPFSRSTRPAGTYRCGVPSYLLAQPSLRILFCTWLT